MIETEEQRRWWFATHPEYSWSRRGIRGGPGREESGERVDPEEVDKWVDEALKYETGAVPDLLKSVKRNFGTEAELKDDLAKWKEAIEADKRGLEADPHTLLDILPYRRFITSPIQAFKNVIRRTAQDQVLSAIKKEGTRTPPRLPRRGTPEYNRIKVARDRGVRAKKKEELNEIRSGGKGSGVWSEEELEGIRKTGKFP